MDSVELIIEQLFRNESARLIAVLTRIFGPHNLELAEDTLQEAFGKALKHWKAAGIPENPAAWLMQTAKNKAIDGIRANKTKMQFAHDLSFLLESEWSLGQTVAYEFEESNIKDDQLRMIFMCCHESIKPENRIPFILKTLCGFSIAAVSRALILPEATVKKRLLRTREKLKSHTFELPAKEILPHAMDSVHTVLYLLFNEGFYSVDQDRPVNEDFCQEAMRLLALLIDEPSIVNQDTFALFALMRFHFARVRAKTDDRGYDVPIDHQDRKRWDKGSIATADRLLQRAHTAPPGASGRFYCEALIAREHCLAACFAETNWQAIAEHYEQLVDKTGSPVARLHRAIAIGYAGNVALAITQVEALEQEKTFQRSYMPQAVLAHLNAKAGNRQRAYQKAEEAKKRGGTPREHHLMMEQLERLLDRAQCRE